MRKVTAFVMALALLLPVLAFGQHDVRVPPFSGTNWLNDVISGDTLANGQRRDPAAEYILQRGGIYLVNATITNTGYPLVIKSHDTTAGISKPIVYLYNTSSGRPPGNCVSVRGNFTIRNCIVNGYFEPTPADLGGLQGALFTAQASGFNIVIDSCILSSTNGNHVRTESAPRVVKITNSTFADMGYLGRSNLGAGKAVDMRNVSCDSLIMVNNTFVNWQDRIIRHFLSTANLEYVRFEHNTLVNGMSYHGLISLGRVGEKVFIKNNLWIDAFALGADSDGVRQSEFTDSREVDQWGYPRMTWVMSVPNDSTFWKVNNNYYHISPDGLSFFDSASVLPIVADPPLTAGDPLTHHINGNLGADSTVAFRSTNVTLPKIPKLMTTFMKWYRRPTANGGAGKTKGTGNWSAAYDFDRHKVEYYRDTLNCAYSVGHELYTAAEGGYPVGDLRWFPARYGDWLNDPVSGIAPGVGEIPESFTLEQNFPNPFNPSTKIRFALPKEAVVTLEVYDLIGRKVATVLNEKRNAGEHTVAFEGRTLSSGVYFYRLATPNQVLTRKMALVK